MLSSGAVLQSCAFIQFPINLAHGFFFSDYGFKPLVAVRTGQPFMLSDSHLLCSFFVIHAGSTEVNRVFHFGLFRQDVGHLSGGKGDGLVAGFFGFPVFKVFQAFQDFCAFYLRFQHIVFHFDHFVLKSFYFFLKLLNQLDVSLIRFNAADFFDIFDNHFNIRQGFFGIADEACGAGERRQQATGLVLVSHDGSRACVGKASIPFSGVCVGATRKRQPHDTGHLPADLTTPLTKKYSIGAAEKSVAGVDSPLNNAGAQAPISLGAFFVPEGFLYGDAHWEAFGLAVARCSRSVNPMRVATILIDSRRWQQVKNQTPETIMNLPILQVCDSATPEALSAFVEALNHQNQALVAAIHDTTQHRKSFSASFDGVNWLLLQLQQNLALQGKVLERLGEVS